MINKTTDYSLTDYLAINDQYASHILAFVNLQERPLDVYSRKLLTAHYHVLLWRLDYAHENGFYDQLEPILRQPLQLLFSVLYKS